MLTRVTAEAQSFAVGTGQVEHPLQRVPGVAGRLRIDHDLVHDVALRQVLQRPHQVRQVDPVHRRAVADVLLEEGDLLLGVGLRQSLHQVELGPDRPLRAGRRLLHLLDDVLGRADEVGLEHDLVHALGVHQDLDAGDAGPYVVDGFGREPAVHRAVAAPQDHRRGLQLLGGQPAAGLARVVDHALVERDAHLQHRGVAAQVLIGEEEHLLAALEGPLQHRLGVRRRTDDAAVLAAEGLDVGRGVHVRHRHRHVGHAGVGQHVPGVLDLGEAGHVRHRAAGGQVGQDDLLMVGGQDVGRLGHEVHAAEDDELRLGPRRRLAGQLERVAGHVGELDDLVALVVVTQHEEPVAERRLGPTGPLDQSRIRGRRQFAGALDAALAERVGTACRARTARAASGSVFASALRWSAPGSWSSGQDTWEDARMRVVVCPDSIGPLSSAEAAEALAGGLGRSRGRTARPSGEAGGGFVAALAAQWGVEVSTAVVDGAPGDGGVRRRTGWRSRCRVSPDPGPIPVDGDVVGRWAVALAPGRAVPAADGVARPGQRRRARRRGRVPFGAGGLVSTGSIWSGWCRSPSGTGSCSGCGGSPRCGDAQIGEDPARLLAIDAGSGRAGGVVGRAGPAGGRSLRRRGAGGAWRSAGDWPRDPEVTLADVVAPVDLVVTGCTSYDFASRGGGVVASAARLAERLLCPCVVLAGEVLIGGREMRTMGVEAAYGLDVGAGEVKVESAGAGRPGRPELALVTRRPGESGASAWRPFGLTVDWESRITHLFDLETI